MRTFDNGSICSSYFAQTYSVLLALLYPPLVGQRNMCHKWLMTGTHMPLQIYRHNKPSLGVISDYILVVALCRCREPLVAQVAQILVSPSTFG